MSKRYSTRWEWNPQQKTACFTIEDNRTGESYMGSSACSKTDYDFVSEKTGLQIAEYRAYIKYNKEEYKRLKKVIEPQIKILNTLHKNMEQSKKFDRDSYEAIQIRKQIEYLNIQLEDLKETIEIYQDNLKAFLDGKDKLYNNIRKLRKKKMDKTK